ncbi:unnamed protein product [Alternaria sp. RS040]
MLKTSEDQRLSAPSSSARLDACAVNADSPMQVGPSADEIFEQTSAEKNISMGKADLSKHVAHDQGKVSCARESDLSSVPSSWSGKRKFWDEVQIQDSENAVAHGRKRQ